MVEGEVNSISVIDLARRVGAELPICQSVHDILHEGADLRDAFRDLWARPIEAEPKALLISLSHPDAAVAS